MKTISDDTPIVMLTVGQLKQLIKDTQQGEAKDVCNYTDKKYIFGLKGIKNEFGISHSTAQKWKDGILKDAVIQHGRKILIDAEKAHKLLKERNERRSC